MQSCGLILWIQPSKQSFHVTFNSLLNYNENVHLQEVNNGQHYTAFMLETVSPVEFQGRIFLLRS